MNELIMMRIVKTRDNYKVEVFGREYKMNIKQVQNLKKAIDLNNLNKIINMEFLY